MPPIIKDQGNETLAYTATLLILGAIVAFLLFKEEEILVSPLVTPTESVFDMDIQVASPTTEPTGGDF